MEDEDRFWAILFMIYVTIMFICVFGSLYELHSQMEFIEYLIRNKK